MNKITVWNQYPIPQIDNLLDQLMGAKYFSEIDMKFGYHQVPIEQTNVWKTSFNSKEGLSPKTFMRMLDDIHRPFTILF
jgi:hypothetical protein